MQLLLCTKQVSMPARDEGTLKKRIVFSSFYRKCLEADRTDSVCLEADRTDSVCLCSGGRSLQWPQRDVFFLKAITRKPLKAEIISVFLAFSELIKFLLGEAKVITC